MKRFEKMDTNHDGNVSKDEIEAYRDAKQAKMKEHEDEGAAEKPAEKPAETPAAK